MKTTRFHFFRSKFFKIIFFLILVVGGIEVVFRVAGIVLLSPQVTANKITAGDKQKLRILALGESTTADYFSESEMGAWPRVLEKKLNQSGIPTRVYNEAIGGTTTGLLVSNLPEYLDRYHPHIVISMMGINDFPHVWLDNSVESKVSMAFSQIRIVKLISWITNSLQSKMNCKIQDNTYDRSRVLKLAQKGLDLSLTHSSIDVKNILQKESLDEKELSFVLREISLRLRGDFSNSVDYRPAREFIDLAFDLNPYDYYNAFWMMNNATRDMCIKASYKLLPCGSNVPDAILSEIMVCGAHDSAILNDPTVRSRGMQLAPQNSSPTARHYRMMVDLLQKQGIKLVAMQYPTLSVETLKSMVLDQADPSSLSADVTFVSNEENFTQALKKNSFEKIFTDRFRGSWGHTTQFGHELIGLNAHEKIKALVDSGCCQARHSTK